MFATLFQAFSRPQYRPAFDTLEIRQWHTAHAVIVRLFGGLWSTNIETFQEAVAPLLDQPKPVIVIDLTGVGFVGSQGISAMLSLAKQLASVGAELRLVAPPSVVRDTLETTHLHRVLKIHETVAGALVDCAGTRM
jgi:anti-anti-sigma factor